MDERLKPGKLHETPAEDNPADTYPEEGDLEFGMRKMEDYPYFPDYNPPYCTQADDEGSSGKLRAERQAKAESGGYDDPGYGKVRSLPSQK